MRKDQTDMIWNMTVLLLGALVLLAGGRLLFFAFGFQSDRPWQFVLFLLIFLALEELFSLFKSKCFPFLLRLFRPEGFLQLILCRSMAETLMVWASCFCCAICPVSTSVLWQPTPLLYSGEALA